MWAQFTFDLKQSVPVFDAYKFEIISPQEFKNDPGRQQRGSDVKKQYCYSAKQWVMTESILITLQMIIIQNIIAWEWGQLISFVILADFRLTSMCSDWLFAPSHTA